LGFHLGSYHAFHDERIVIALAQGLHLRLIADSVRAQAQAERLPQIGCAYFKGYPQGPPMAPPYLAQWIRRHPAVPPVTQRFKGMLIRVQPKLSAATELYR
jgi:predicted signal transduction protein with EAL and GGDEF domain